MNVNQPNGNKFTGGADKEVKNADRIIKV